jgi:energy-coupling factor transport system substrate-specific component
MMAALAALGGVVSTYVNAIGDFFQSILGFAGTTQWAAGLHVLWLVLAVGLTKKQGAGTITGILKGGVELLTGNTHGLLVVLVDIVAGLLVDLGFLPFRDKDRLPAYCLAGGLASASNVLVFQLFASLPADALAYGVLLIVAGVAAASGVIFAGLLGYTLLRTLRRAGVVRDQAPTPMSRRIYIGFLATAVVLSIAFALFLRQTLSGPAAISIDGAVQAPYEYPQEHGDLPMVTAEGTLRDVTTRYTGVRLRDLLSQADPEPDASTVLITATDGYAFFIDMQEVRDNDALLLAPQDEGEDASYNIVGARNSKAWIRGVERITIIGTVTLEIVGALDHPGTFDPNDWQFDMDNTRLDLGDGPRKYQGAPLGKVLQSMAPQPEATQVLLYVAEEDEPISIELDQVLADDDIRIFSAIEETNISFAVARINGEIVAAKVNRIEVR